MPDFATLAVENGTTLIVRPGPQGVVAGEPITVDVEAYAFGQKILEAASRTVRIEVVHDWTGTTLQLSSTKLAFGERVVGTLQVLDKYGNDDTSNVTFSLAASSPFEIDIHSDPPTLRSSPRMIRTPSKF